MTSRDFCFWLQGYFEISGSAGTMAPNQVVLIRRHLDMVFKHEIDPSMPDPTGELQGIHDGKPPLTPPPHSGGDQIYRC